MTRALSQQTDEELIAEFQRENAGAFDILVARYKDPLTNFVFRFVGDRDESNDIVQDTFVRVYRSRHSYKPVARFSTWIYTIATNLAKTQLRKRKVRGWFGTAQKNQEDQSLQPEIVDESSRADELAETSIQDEHIQHALDSLSDKYREVIVLRDVQELSYEEIAEVTGLSLGTVKSRINRGRTQLKEMLKDIWNE